MTRRFLGYASLLLTLLAGGCQFARQSRNDSTAANPQPTTIQPFSAKKPQELPDTLPLTSDAPPSPPKTNAAAPPAKWPEITRPPQALTANPPVLHNVPPATLPPLLDLTPKHPIVLALEAMLDNRPHEAQQHLRIYDARTQEFLMRMLPFMSLIAKNNNLSAADIAALIPQVERLKAALQQNAEFAVPKMCFCKSIKEYAIYEPLPPDHEFVAALPDRPGELVQLYVEIKNFACRQNHGEFETRLASRIEIQDDKGKEKWSHLFDPNRLKLVSRTRLGEYYQHYTFLLPANLPPGFYTLIVEMTDQTLTDAPPRTALGSLPFRVTASR